MFLFSRDPGLLVLDSPGEHSRKLEVSVIEKLACTRWLYTRTTRRVGVFFTPFHIPGNQNSENFCDRLRLIR